MKNKKSNIPAIYIVVALILLVGEATETRILVQIIKVFLMPLLIFWVLLSDKDKKAAIFLILGLFFSWGGDIFLMFVKKHDAGNSKTLFILGLASFLIAHVNYIIYFIKELKDKFTEGFIFKNPLNLIPFITFVIAILYYLGDGVTEVRIPVYIYCIVISLMSIAALNRKYIVNNQSFTLVFIGSLLFMLSDAMIAIQAFKTNIPLSGVWIMITYMTAQYLIVKGALANLNTKKILS